MNALKIERLRLAVHMLRSLSMHAALASEKGSEEAMRVLSEAAEKEAGFIERVFQSSRR